MQSSMLIGKIVPKYFVLAVVSATEHEMEVEFA
jgi:hypothetical protein